MKNVMIATPSFDGKVDIQYNFSLFETFKLAQKYGINILPFYISYNSIIQIVRNDLLRHAYNTKVDGIFFIDADMGWEPQSFIDIVKRDEDVVGGIVPSRWNDDHWNVYIDRNKQLNYSEDNELLKVEKIGTGFLRLTRKVIVDLYNNSTKYRKEEEPNTTANVFEVKVENGMILGEDYVLSNKLHQLGYTCWGAHKVNPTHIGVSINNRNFSEYLQRNNYKV